MYLAFAQSAFQTQLAYRTQVWASLFGSLVHVFAWIAIWISVYAGDTRVEGVSLQQMLTYALIGGTLLSAWQWRRVLNTVGNSVGSGDVVIYLLKPLHYPLYLLATELGNYGYRMLVISLPVIAAIAALYGILPPATPFHGAMFIPFVVLSFVIIFLLAVLCGLLSFWLMTAFSLEWLLQGILSLLSGTAIPFWFFPEPLAAIARLLPFAWIGYHPLAVYLGRTSTTETLVQLALGLGWALLLATAVGLLWRRAALRLTVQGG